MRCSNQIAAITTSITTGALARQNSRIPAQLSCVLIAPFTRRRKPSANKTRATSTCAATALPDLEAEHRSQLAQAAVGRCDWPLPQRAKEPSRAIRLIGAGALWPGPKPRHRQRQGEKEESAIHDGETRDAKNLH